MLGITESLRYLYMQKAFTSKYAYYNEINKCIFISVIQVDSSLLSESEKVTNLKSYCGETSIVSFRWVWLLLGAHYGISRYQFLSSYIHIDHWMSSGNEKYSYKIELLSKEQRSWRSILFTKSLLSNFANSISFCLAQFWSLSLVDK